MSLLIQTPSTCKTLHVFLTLDVIFAVHRPVLGMCFVSLSIPCRRAVHGACRRGGSLSATPSLRRHAEAQIVAPDVG